MLVVRIVDARYLNVIRSRLGTPYSTKGVDFVFQNWALVLLSTNSNSFQVSKNIFIYMYPLQCTGCFASIKLKAIFKSCGIS